MRKVLLTPSILVVALLALAIATWVPVTQASGVTRDTYLPPKVCTPAAGAAPVCSVWEPKDAWTGRPFAVMTTAIPAGVGITAYIAWIRPSRTDLGLYPG